MDAARALIVERGFHATGVAQIEAASGVRVQQIYRDFCSKEGVIAAIAAADADACIAEPELDRAVAAGDRAAIRRWLRRSGTEELSDDECRMMAEIFAEAARNPRIRAVVDDLNARVLRAIARALDALTPGIALARRDALAELLMTLGVGVMTSRATRTGYPLAAVRDAVGRVVDCELEALARTART